MIRLTASCLFVFFVALPQITFGQETAFFASGIKVGEATQDTVYVWVRLTEKPKADFEKLPILTEGLAARKRSTQLMPGIDLVPGKARLGQN